MGAPVGVRHRAPAAGIPLWADRFGTLLAAWEMDDPTITLTSGRVTTLPNRYNPGTHDLVEVGTDGPTYEATGWNGQPSMVFNGTDEYMIADSVAASFSGDDKPMTIIMAVQAVSRTYGDYLWTLGESGSDVHWYGMYDQGTNVDTRREDDLGVTKAASGGVATSANRFVLSQVFNGTTVDTFYDGAADVSAGDLDVGTCTHDMFAIACSRRAGNTAFANIRVGAVWLYTNALSDDAAVAASKAMARRWTWV